jgi:putative membrane protein
VRNFVLRLIVNAIALAAAAAILPGISISSDSTLTLLLVALIFGVMNAIVKPILVILSCPLIIVTLGIFYLVVNGFMLILTDAISGGRFTVDGLGSAILGALIVGFVASILEGALGLKEDKNKKKKKKDDVIIFSR